MPAVAPTAKPFPRQSAPQADDYELGPVISDIQHYHLKSVRVLEGFRLCLRFKDDFMAEVDFEPWIQSAERGPMSRPLIDEHYFSQVYLDHGVLTWPNGFDLHPETLRYWAELGFCG